MLYVGVFFPPFPTYNGDLPNFLSVLKLNTLVYVGAFTFWGVPFNVHMQNKNSL